MPTLTGLAARRIRRSPLQFVAAVILVATLVAGVAAFQAIVAGMQHGVVDAIDEERANHLRYAVPMQGQPTMLSAQDLAVAQGWPGVTDVYGMGVGPSGVTIEGPDGRPAEFTLVSLDAASETGSVVQAPPGATYEPRGFDIVVGTGANYTMLAGRWIERPGEAVVSTNLAALHNVGDEIPLPAGGSAHVVGVVQTASPANLPAPGLVPIGYMIVDRADAPVQDYVAMTVVARPDYDSIQSVVDRMRRAYPDSYAQNRASLEDFEGRHFDLIETEGVLRALTRLSLAVGAVSAYVTVLVLVREERIVMGVLGALGFPSGSVKVYGAIKLVLVLVAGLTLGLLAASALLAVIPIPVTDYDVSVRLDGSEALPTIAAATLALVVAGSLALSQAAKQHPSQLISGGGQK